MKLLVTAGGTREPIDDVRYVGNASTGATGARIVEEAVRRYHTVYYLSGVGSVLPASWAMETGLVVRREFTSAQSLLDACGEWTRDYRFDAIVFAAAVADYRPESVSGKIKSDRPVLDLHMVPTPKVLDSVRSWAPEAVLVGFKLESGVDVPELVERARQTAARSGAQWMVANLAEGMGREDHPSVILSAQGEVIEVPQRRQLAETLIRLLEDGSVDGTGRAS